MLARQYILIFISLVFVLLGLSALLNRIVDPFWYYRDVWIGGVNTVKPKFRDRERHVKPAIVRREQPASLIFGSSYSEIGFDPLHPALTAAGKSYNFALAGERWGMVLCNVLFAISHDAALHQIVLGIHLEAMPEQSCATEIVRMQHPDEKAFLLSLDALTASINTVLQQNKHGPSHTAEGMFFYTRGLPETAGRFREHFAEHMPCKIDHIVEKRSDANSRTLDMPSWETQPIEDLSGLREIVRKTIAEGIVVKLVLYPHHALLLEQDYQCGVRQKRWNALTQIVSMLEREKASLVEVWDFEGYHRIGTEVISDAPGVYWQDPAHFNYEFGNIMLDEMFGLKPAQFGMRLTIANIATRAENERKARETFLNKHPEFLQQLQSLLPDGKIDRARRR